MAELPSHIVVFRFSALGDVAMTVPVLKCLLHQHPQLQVTVVSVPFVQPIFEGIDRLSFYGVDIKKEYKGVGGIWRLAKKIKADIGFDAIADLHNVLRTKLLRFFLPSFKKAVIDKGRKEKAELTRPANKNLHPLKTTFQRYADVFHKLGFPITLDIALGIKQKTTVNTSGFVFPIHKKLIGIAPFAKHNAKMYPLQEMEKVVQLLSANEQIQVVLIGSKQEAAILQGWANKYENIINIAGKYNLQQELQIIAGLNVLLSMDSANMHLASLVGVPVVSLWGGTHPWLGFYGWGQPYENALQENLPCRPSSVFGNKPCPVHGEAGCMQGISPNQVAEKLETIAFQ